MTTRQKPGYERRGKGGWEEVLETEAPRVAPGRVTEASRMRAAYP